MRIRGPEIVTPGGNQTRGEYTRHSFLYVVPAGEAGAGDNVSIVLLSRVLCPCATRLRYRSSPGVEPLPAGRGRREAYVCGRNERLTDSHQAQYGGSIHGVSSEGARRC